MTLLGLTFASPFILLGLLTLPVIWWLLRLTPPKPKQEVFPPTRILEEITKREETPSQSPWWLTLLRLLMAALVILALSEPAWNARKNLLAGDGPVLLVVDDGWAAGRDWDQRQTTARQLLEEASKAGRPVALALASEGEAADLSPKTADEIATRIAAASAQPVATELAGLADKISKTATKFKSVVWLSSGLDQPGTENFATSLSQAGTSEVLYYPADNKGLHVLSKAANTPEALALQVERAGQTGEETGRATAFDQQGRSIATSDYLIAVGVKTADVKFELPVELRNEVVRIAIDGAGQAGSVQLLDERFRRRRVGLISGGNSDQAQPLLSPLYYISRALEPFSDVRPARQANVAQAVPELVNERISTLVLADIGTLPSETLEQVENWVDAGGMLIRFAGPRLAAAEDDTLVPVALRRGGRSLGGTLTWGTPEPLANFDTDSPFNGIPVPDDVSVTRQVLAEPGIDLEDKTWASLADGTPLVTAAQRGKGWIVLFHVTADASWSNLPLSGAFVDMLRRIVAVSNGAVAADKTRAGSNGTVPAGEETGAAVEVSLSPLRMISSTGAMAAPGPNMRPLVLAGSAKPVVSLENPPGTYGTSDAFVALNLFEQDANLNEIDPAILPANTRQQTYAIGDVAYFKPWLLGAALLLLALDCLAVLWMAGALRREARPAAAVLTLGLAIFLLPDSGRAQDAVIDFQNALKTHLAYVKTGDAQIDEISRKGLIGLTAFVASRTSLEPGDPVAIDVSNDELSYYPLLYWPISTSSIVPDEKSMARVDAFMKKGGSVLFDTRDQLSGGFGSQQVSSETQRLRQILATLDIPPLEPVPDNHVLTRAFYILNVFPGRYLDGKLWVETSENDGEENPDRPTRQGDGVSSILITSNDLAAAWAVEPDGSPSLPTVPPNPTQRAYAYRTGVNILMYTLTGNYKSDQVHIPALLERLGQ